ncbi:MAG: hypothetical protein ACTSYD_13940 [Candidatus Heimdallarchaeaceae archaeon]
MSDTTIILASYALSRVQEYYDFHKSININIDLHYALLLGEYLENSLKIYAFYFPPPDRITPIMWVINAFQKSKMKALMRFKGKTPVSIVGICYFTSQNRSLPLQGDKEAINTILKFAPNLPFLVMKVPFSKLNNIISPYAFEILEHHNITRPRFEILSLPLSTDRVNFLMSLIQYSNMYCSEKRIPRNILISYHPLSIEMFEFHYYQRANPALQHRLETIKKEEQLSILSQYFWDIPLGKLVEILKIDRQKLIELCSHSPEFQIVSKRKGLAKEDYLEIKDSHLETLSRNLLQYKIKHNTYPTQSVLFVEEGMSLDQIKDVCRYISSEVRFDIKKLLKFINYDLSLLQEHEEASKIVLEEQNVNLAELVITKKMSVAKAKRILAYISAVSTANLSRVPDTLPTDVKAEIESIARKLIKHIREEYGIEDDKSIARELSRNLVKYLRSAKIGLLTGKLAAVYVLENLYRTDLSVTLPESIVHLKSFVLNVEGTPQAQESVFQEKSVDQFCPHCGALLPKTEASLYICPFCGGSLPICPVCSKNVNRDERVFCPICGVQYHDDCAKSWISLHSECKVCKTRATLTNFEAVWKKDLEMILERVNRIRELGVEGVIKQIFELAHPSGTVQKAEIIEKLGILPQTLERIVEILKKSELLIEENEHGNIVYYIPSAWEYSA